MLAGIFMVAPLEGEDGWWVVYPLQMPSAHAERTGELVEITHGNLHIYDVLGAERQDRRRANMVDPRCRATHYCSNTGCASLKIIGPARSIRRNHYGARFSRDIEFGHVISSGVLRPGCSARP